MNELMKESILAVKEMQSMKPKVMFVKQSLQDSSMQISFVVLVCFAVYILQRCSCDNRFQYYCSIVACLSHYSTGYVVQLHYSTGYVVQLHYSTGYVVQ